MNTVFTIGYEGTDFTRFAVALEASGAQVVADVRAVALSRKAKFSKTSLTSALEAQGFGYVHLPDLGDPKDGREAARAGRYAEFRRIYAEHLASARAQLSLDILADIAIREPTALMCFERDPITCHRSIIAGRLAERGLTVVHLYGDLPVCHDGPVRPSRNIGQGAPAA